MTGRCKFVKKKTNGQFDLKVEFLFTSHTHSFQNTTNENVGTFYRKKNKPEEMYLFYLIHFI
jgi:hypothetical protein